MTREDRWSTEAEMCGSFMEAATESGWTPYPETAGFDIVLVRGDTQVGVEAKLRAGCHVLSQALPSEGSRRGPNYVAVLVPSWGPPGFGEIADRVKVRVVVWSPRRANPFPRFGPYGTHDPLRWRFEAPLALPPVVPTWQAGCPSPQVLSPWRVRALRLCHELRRGPVSSARFKAHGMKPSDWKRSGYVVPVRDDAGALAKEGRNTVWEIAQPEHCYFPDKGYEAERDAIAAAECEGAAS